MSNAYFIAFINLTFVHCYYLLDAVEVLFILSSCELKLTNKIHRNVTSNLIHKKRLFSGTFLIMHDDANDILSFELIHFLAIKY